MQQWLFVDGSGKPTDRSHVAYCGYLVLAEDADAFFDRWNAVLHAEQIPYFSMKDAQRWSGIWELKRQQWGADAEVKRRDLLLRLAEAVGQSRVFQFGHGVNTASCREKQVEPTEYYLFVKLLEAVLKLQGASMAALSIIVDEEEAYAERIYKFFRRIRREKADVAGVVKLIGIGDDKSIPGLQAADMLASVTVAELRRMSDRPDDAPDELYVALMRGAKPAAITHEWLIADPAEFLKLAGIS